MNKKVKTILEILVDVLVVLVFVVAIVVVSATINGKKTGIKSAFGLVFNEVITDSMSGTFEVGDIIVEKLYKKQELKEDMIVSFKDLNSENKPFVNTHRIVEIDGDRIYTKGDNSEYRDTRAKVAGDILYIYKFRLPKLAVFVNWLKSPLGFILCLVLPIVVFIIYQIYKIIIIIQKDKKDNEILDVAQNASEEVKDAIIREYLEKQKQEQNKE